MMNILNAPDDWNAIEKFRYTTTKVSMIVIAAMSLVLGIIGLISGNHLWGFSLGVFSVTFISALAVWTSTTTKATALYAYLIIAMYTLLVFAEFVFEINDTKHSFMHTITAVIYSYLALQIKNARMITAGLFANLIMITLITPEQQLLMIRYIITAGFVTLMIDRFVVIYEKSLSSIETVLTKEQEETKAEIELLLKATDTVEGVSESMASTVNYLNRNHLSKEEKRRAYDVLLDGRAELSTVIQLTERIKAKYRERKD